MSDEKKPELIYLAMLVKVRDNSYLGLFSRPGIIEDFFMLDIENTPNIDDNRIVVVQANIKPSEKGNDIVKIRVKEQLALVVNKSITEAYDDGKLKSLCQHVYMDIITHIISNRDKMDAGFIKLLENARYI